MSGAIDPWRPAFDVVILGGGLAGAAAAIGLAPRGMRVLVVERHRYPRHKLCGEFLSAETTPLFDRLGVGARIQALAPARLTSARISAPGGACLDLPLPAPALGLSRYQLDRLLLARAAEAGATVWEGCDARSLSGSLNDGFVIQTRNGPVHARVVLGAWGKRASLDRALERPFFRQKAPFLALKCHVEGPETGPRTELHAFPGGYCGLNRIEGGRVNVCLLASDAAWEAAGRSVEGMWTWMQAQNPALRLHLASARRLSEMVVISNISFARKGATSGDLLMLGDSAELISPLAGNGQAMALGAAEIAVPLVAAFLEGRTDGRALQQRYRRAWRRRFRERLLLGRLLQPLFLRPPLLTAALHLGRRFPPLAHRLVSGTRERAGSND